MLHGWLHTLSVFLGPPASQACCDVNVTENVNMLMAPCDNSALHIYLQQNNNNNHCSQWLNFLLHVGAAVPFMLLQIPASPSL